MRVIASEGGPISPALLLASSARNPPARQAICPISLLGEKRIKDDANPAAGRKWWSR